MKTIICILAVTLSGSLSAFAPIRSASTGSILQDTVGAPPPPAPVIYSPKDPYRELYGLRFTLAGVDVKGGWVQFEGTVLEVQHNGIRMSGWYTGNYGADGQPAEFFVTNFSYAVAEKEKITIDTAMQQFYLAHTAGVYSYNTVAGGSRTLRMLDYGETWVPTAEDIAAAQRAAQAKKEAEKIKADEGKAKALKMNQDAADKGDAYGLYRMGERYRDGDGVEKDLNKARDYLTRAAAAGSSSAQAELDALKK